MCIHNSNNKSKTNTKIFCYPKYERETRETDSEMCIQVTRNKSETTTNIFGSIKYKKQT